MCAGDSLRRLSLEERSGEEAEQEQEGQKAVKIPGNRHGLILKKRCLIFIPISIVWKCEGKIDAIMVF